MSVIWKFDVPRGPTVRETADRIKREWDDCVFVRDRPERIEIDAAGLGIAVVDHLAEMGLPVKAVRSPANQSFNARAILSAFS